MNALRPESRRKRFSDSSSPLRRIYIVKSEISETETEGEGVDIYSQKKNESSSSFRRIFKEKILNTMRQVGGAVDKEVWNVVVPFKIPKRTVFLRRLYPAPFRVIPVVM